MLPYPLPIDESLAEPQRLLDALATCRAALVEASAGTRPLGAAYHACEMVIRAIDALVYFLAGRPPGALSPSVIAFKAARRR